MFLRKRVGVSSEPLIDLVEWRAAQERTAANRLHARLNELLEHGSEQILPEKGLIAIHGRDYVVEDGDLILLRIQR